LAETAVVASIALPPYLMAQVAELGIDRRAFRAALHLGSNGVPRFAAHRVATAAGQTARAELGMRARYILAAAKRITASVGHGSNLFDALHTERRHLDSHLAAQRNRAQAAQAVDVLAQQHTWLRWQAVLDERTTPDCRQLSGQVFTVDQPLTDPTTGRPTWPGSQHVHCRCFPAPAFESTPFGEQPTVTAS